MKKIFLIISLSVISILMPFNVNADPFNKGSIGLEIMLGQGTAFNNTYDIFGIGASYYVIDGLELGLGYEVWRGGSPEITQYSPKVNYVLSLNEYYSLYLGGFYRLRVIDGLPNDKAIGGRLGLYVRSGSNLFFGFGVARIQYQNCVETAINNCSDTYPEFTVGVSL